MMHIARVHFVVDNAQAWRDWFAGVLGFQVIGDRHQNETTIAIVRSGSAVFWLMAPTSDRSPAAAYLRAHPPGVADLALAVDDLTATLARALQHGAELLQPLAARAAVPAAQIRSPAGLQHTLLAAEALPPLAPDGASDFTGIDHAVLNVPSGQLAPTLTWYEQALGFERQQQFAIQTDYSGLHSQVLVHPTSGLQLPVNEPASPGSQIQEFLDANRGAGIQHIALRSRDIVAATARRRAAGLAFLNVPPSYYQEARQRYAALELSADEWAMLAELQILADSQAAELHAQAPLLLQIFTQPIFGEPTFFFELIERRRQAQGFGEGNFRALFQAIEAEQRKRGSLPG